LKKQNLATLRNSGHQNRKSPSAGVYVLTQTMSANCRSNVGPFCSMKHQ